jgi:hypothetical protein
MNVVNAGWQLIQLVQNVMFLWLMPALKLGKAKVCKYQNAQVARVKLNHRAVAAKK